MAKLKCPGCSWCNGNNTDTTPPICDGSGWYECECGGKKAWPITEATVYIVVIIAMVIMCALCTSLLKVLHSG